MDIEVVNVCKRCGEIHHILCASKRKEMLKKKAPNAPQMLPFSQALKEAVGGGERERSRFLDVLTCETTGLECPNCGSFEFSAAFSKEDDTPIVIKSGVRID